MVLHFKSTYTINGNETNVIKHTSNMKKWIENNLVVLEFEEKRFENIIKTRIEYNDSSLTIFSGKSTLDFALNQKIKIKYKTEHGIINMFSWLKEIKEIKNGVEFFYEISTDENNWELSNKFHLELNWEENL